ncbi:hypothetical protein Rxycam_01608 [Rubrobacter xylanophilus DSM 9941]|uniref:HPP family protein n=1 Tax=Rubrobacter xylanophilus TaxID=49319 RepID=UPI001C63B877|nr:HPP family protein [Rubrobacter xylanophilus]QYJ15780.1 hypothetical protein Rxycam_01608 [Rubrobacter xylanophilus DSM 9941]
MRSLKGYLADRLGRPGEAFYAFCAGFVAIAASGGAAYLLKQPLLFPSLGPTAFLFFETPLAEISTPRNTMIGHLVAAGSGYASLAVFGLLDAPGVLQAGVGLARIGAAALSVALTSALLLLLRSPHPPAGATTLIVSLGLLSTPHELGMLALGAALLTAVGWAINRAAGVPVPVWGPRREGG